MRPFEDGDEFIYLSTNHKWVVWERKDQKWFAFGRECATDETVNNSLNVFKDANARDYEVTWVRGETVLESYK